MNRPPQKIGEERHFNTQDNSNRFYGDELLRRWGFHIVARPRKGEAVWERHGQRFTQTQAEREAAYLEQAEAEALK
jgi:hypothetical protein